MYKPATLSARRAYELLQAHLSPGQREDLEILGQFTEKGRRHDYTINLNTGRIVRVGTHDWGGLCVRVSDWTGCPVADQALTMLLIIRTSEAGFLATANTLAVWPPPRERSRRMT